MLGIDRAASEDDVRAAFRKLSRKTHPDVGGTGGLYRLLVDARDAMLAGAGSALDDSPRARQDAATRPPPSSTRQPPQPQPPRDEWVVDDEDPYAHRRYEAPPQPPPPRPPPRQAAPEDFVGYGATSAAQKGGFLATLAPIPAPHTLKGWGRLGLLWIVLNTIVGQTAHHDVVGVLSVLVVGWFPIVLIAAALARRWVQRVRWFR